MTRKIVLAVDDSPISKDAVAWAATKLCNANDEVHIISVLEPGNRPGFVTAGESSFPVQEQENDCKPDPIQMEKRGQLLKTYKEKLSAGGTTNVQLTTLVSCMGGSTDMARHICEYAAESKADMLVMGSRGMGSAKRAVLGLFGLGSVSDFVVRHATVPNVLVHRGQPNL